MPKGLKRYYRQHHLQSITCSCYRRLPLLRSVRAKSVFVKIPGEVRERNGFVLVGYVVMPEHIHLLIGEPARDRPSTIMQVLSSRASRLGLAFWFRQVSAQWERTAKKERFLVDDSSE
jgi:putative transposase